MKRRNIIMKQPTIILALAAMVIASSFWTAAAQTFTTLKGSTLVGFIPGQTLRISMANLRSPEEYSQPVRVQAYIYDSYGNLLRQTDSVDVRPGQFHTFDIHRDDLLAAGEPGTGRLQVRADFQFLLDAQPAISPNKFPVTVEVLDTRSGTSSGGDYYTGTVTVSGDGF